MDAFCRVIIDVPLGTSLEEIKERAIDAVLEVTGGSMEKTTEALGISETTLLRRLGKRSLGRLANSQTHPHDLQGVGPRTGAGAGADVSGPPPLGGQRK